MMRLGRAAPATTRSTGRRSVALFAACTGLGALILFVLVGPLLLADPVTVVIGERRQGPSLEHLLGTDLYGRDLLARVATGGRYTLGAAALGLAIALVVGLTVGALTALAGRRARAVVARLLDIGVSMPGPVIALAVVGALGPGFGHLIVGLSVGYGLTYARLARGFAHETVSRAYVSAARLAGVTRPRIARVHVLPAVVAGLAGVVVRDLGTMIVAIAGFSFVGLGISPPTPEWGAMLFEASRELSSTPHLLYGPTIAIVATLGVAHLLAAASAPGGERW